MVLNEPFWAKRTAQICMSQVVRCPDVAVKSLVAILNVVDVKLPYRHVHVPVGCFGFAPCVVQFAG